MPQMPAFCTQCGCIFDSGILVDNSTNVRFSNVSSSCPRCGGIGKVPDGLYNVLGDVVQLLSGPDRSFKQLQDLHAVLLQARARADSQQVVKTQIEKIAPELHSLASALPTTRNELYAFLSLMLLLLGTMIAGYAAMKPSGPSASEVTAMIDKAIADSKRAELKGEKSVPKKRATPKIGRNEPCPCGSGKKHKRCCLAAEA